MARGGRPVERPAHLSPEQRQQAQQRTRQWRDQTGLSQKVMAAKIGVGYATYRLWENGRDHYAGPTRLQTDQLNKALRRLLGNDYSDGEAFDVWGWPREQDMSYDQVVEFLRLAGFDVPRLQSNGRPATGVFWVHRVREPNLVHGVFALAAAAATRAGLSVHLVLDDVDLEPSDQRRRRELCDEFESRVRGWVAFASGDDAKLSTGLFSSVLTDEYLATRGWSAINDYLNTQSNVLDILLASKVISPLQYKTDAEESVLGLLRSEDPPRADRLLTPLQNWLVFEAEIGRLLASSSDIGSDSIVTLGGDDEQILWEVWRRGCADNLATRVQHIYLKPLPMPPYRRPWRESALSARTDRSLLTNYLVHRTAADGHSDLIEWLLRSAIRLPASLNPGGPGGGDEAGQVRGHARRADAIPVDVVKAEQYQQVVRPVGGHLPADHGFLVEQRHAPHGVVRALELGIGVAAVALDVRHVVEQPAVRANHLRADAVGPQVLIEPVLPGVIAGATLGDRITDDHDPRRSARRLARHRGARRGLGCGQGRTDPRGGGPRGSRGRHLAGGHHDAYGQDSRVTSAALRNAQA
jgi:transcriptional regulator with XRE-family HTH domain